ncbi:MAG: ABC transporter permease [Chloroflexota bacterium]|nr:ABC transporter permease [Chloroflexota bacterium]MDE2883668.1 ABC transporter permease [Chloroflexota bacterium]
MTPLALLLTAWSSIGGNRLRTGLTLLGIIIGVAAVISLMSIGRGAQESIRQQFESLGSDLLFINPGSPFERGELTLDDAFALVDPVYAPSIARVAPEVTEFGAVAYRDIETFGQVSGVTAEFARVRNFEVAIGEFISPVHVLNRKNVAVLGSRIAENLFGDRDPVGAEVAIESIRFTVIGVLMSKGANSFGIEDEQVFVPLTTAFYRLIGGRTSRGDIPVDAINVQAMSGLTDEAEREATTVLRLRHEITEADDFSINTQQSVIDALSESIGTLTLFLGSVAGISLLVGGIGIMNIMLVSVTERTREIGIRKALGARRRDILAQFVTEAVLLSMGGGLIGVATGAAVSRVLNELELLGGELTMVFSGDIAALALGVSAGIGLFFGIYPAVQAARLHPVGALRHE